jgi:tetratricopeptide (TPR) repeat protein
VEQEPDSSVVQFYLGEVYYNRGLNEPALAALERAVSLNPDNANAHYLMAFVLGDLGRHQDARAASKRAIQLNPPLARAQTNLSLERYRAERESAEQRLRATPVPEVVEGHELAHYNSACVPAAGYYTEALREYRLALEARRGPAARPAGDGGGLPAEARLRRRAELYESLIHEVPESPKLWNERGVVLAVGRTAGLIPSGDGRGARYPLAWNNGSCCASARYRRGAIEAFRKAPQLSSSSRSRRLNLDAATHRGAQSLRRRVLEDQPPRPAWNGVGLVPSSEAVSGWRTPSFVPSKPIRRMPARIIT